MSRHLSSCFSEMGLECSPGSLLGTVWWSLPLVIWSCSPNSAPSYRIHHRSLFYSDTDCVVTWAQLWWAQQVGVWNYQEDWISALLGHEKVSWLYFPLAWVAWVRCICLINCSLRHRASGRNGKLISLRDQGCTSLFWWHLLEIGLKRGWVFCKEPGRIKMDAAWGVDERSLSRSTMKQGLVSGSWRWFTQEIRLVVSSSFRPSKLECFLRL